MRKINTKELKKISSDALDYESDDQDFRIRKILGNIDLIVSHKNLKKYLSFLEKNLILPCDVIGHDYHRGKKFKLLEINYDYADETYGLFGVVKNINDKTIGEIPLCDIESKDKKSSSHTLLDDYSVWFVNNR